MTREWSAPESAKLGAVIAGADNWVDIESFGNAKLEWFETFLELPNGITLPRHLRGHLRARLFHHRRAELPRLFIEWTKPGWEAAEGAGRGD